MPPSVIPAPFDVPGQQVVLENEHCLFLQKPDPELRGSGLIVPKRACRTVFDLSAEEWNDTFDLLKKAKRLLDEEHAPDGYNVGWNCDAAAGQNDFHAHLHVIPRFEDEPLSGKGIRYAIKQPSNARAQPS